jgi:hypothetical protein
MEKDSSKVTAVEYLLGFLSFIPLLGVLLGVISIVLGALKFKSGGWKVVLLGVGGILVTVGLYGALFLFMFSGKDNMMTQMQGQMAKANLRQCVMDLEFYRQVHGAYPDKLEDLPGAKGYTPGTTVNFMDQSGGFGANFKFQLFYYEKLPDGSGYYLLGRGPDGEPFTADDVLPDLSPGEQAHSGFRVKQPGS